MENRPKDPCINFRNIVRGQSKTKDALNPQGSERLQLYLNQEQIPVLIEALQAHLENERGVNIDLHIKKRENTHNGNIFESPFAFIKAVQEPQSVARPRQGFVPKGTPTTATLSRTEKVRRELED